MSAAGPITVQWHEVDKPFSGLKTNETHEIEVQREAIPLVFVPGIMGSRLRRSGTNGTGDGDDGLPNMRWDPNSKAFMWWHYSGTSGAHRKRMIVGPGAYDGGFLEVDNADPVGDGFQGLYSDSYLDFLQFLQNPATWGPLTKIFELPVFAMGYNWTDTNHNGGKRLAARITQIIDEAKRVTGACEKVILITHSMGGLVSRAATLLHGAQSKILGIIHGVQPVTGSGAAYWRVKAGFEGNWIASRVLGNSGLTVTPILGNIPGGLELLPNHLYRDNDDNRDWLRVTEDDKTLVALPKSDPYKEIYRVQATGSEVTHPDRRYWALIDPDLLDPGANPPPEDADPDDPDVLDAEARESPWDRYLAVLQMAETFQRAVGTKAHPATYPFHGTGHNSADRIVMEVESVWVERDSYRTRGFWGRFNNAQGERRRAKLQAPAGAGDGTVPTSSATALDDNAARPPEPLGTPAEHEPAYTVAAARDFVVRAIAALCKQRYEEKRGP